MANFNDLVEDCLDELKHGRTTKPGGGKYYNIKKTSVKGPRNGVGIERDKEGKLRATVVNRGVGHHKPIRKLPAKFDHEHQAKDFAKKTARELGINYFGKVNTPKGQKR